jgi:hypothetical protein
MNKWKALGLGLLFLLLAIIAWANGGDVVAWWLLPFAVWFLPQGIWKFYRDWAIISQAKQERQQTIERQAERPELPPMTSPGSHRLFVPPPRGK